MTATFLVKVEIGDASEIDIVADDIEESLSSDAFEVISVEPWARPTQGISGEETGNLGFGSESVPPLF